MSQFQCTACGGALQPTTNAPTMQCIYCGTLAVVPEELRAALAAAQPKVEPAPEPKPEPKPEAKVEEKPAKVEPKPEAKVEPKPEPKPAAKTEAKPEAKAEVKKEAKPATQPKAEPKPAADLGTKAAAAATGAAASTIKAGGMAAPQRQGQSNADNVYVKDELLDPATDWEVGDQGDGIEVGYTEDGYQIYLDEEESWWESYAGLDEVADVSVEVEAKRVRGPRGGSYGVVARVNEDGEYSFEIDGEGYYGIYKCYYSEDADDDETLAEGDEEGVVNVEKQAVNHIRGVCKGSVLQLYINGKLALEAEDDEFESGDVGIAASTEEVEKGGLDVRFRNFVAQQP